MLNRPPLATKATTSTTTTTTSAVVDGNSARRDFLTYALSLMRAHSSEHFDGLPSTDVASLKHIAYILDAYICYLRISEHQDTSLPWFETDENNEEYIFYDALSNHRNTSIDAPHDDWRLGKKHSFFQRSESTIFLGCTPPDPFNVPLHEALPLAEQPHLLQPFSRKEDLFGIPRQLVQLPPQLSSNHGHPPFNHQPLDHLPIHLSLTQRSFVPIHPAPPPPPSSNRYRPFASSNHIPPYYSSRSHSFTHPSSSSLSAPPAHSIYPSILSITPPISNAPSFGSTVIVSLLSTTAPSNTTPTASSFILIPSTSIVFSQPSTSFTIQSDHSINPPISSSFSRYTFGSPISLQTSPSTTANYTSRSSIPLIDLSNTHPSTTTNDRSNPIRSISSTQPLPLLSMQQQASVIVHVGSSSSNYSPHPPINYYDNNHLFLSPTPIFGDPRHIVSNNTDHQDIGLDLTNPSKNSTTTLSESIFPPISSHLSVNSFLTESHTHKRCFLLL